jgi:peptidoglycan/xylan/chitin deacetylase (PgdA/CDA1 family)
MNPKLRTGSAAVTLGQYGIAATRAASGNRAAPATNVAGRIAALGFRCLGGSGGVLCFHGITAETHPSRNMANLPVDLFRRCVETARSLGEIVPLRTLLRRHRDGRSTRGLVALTFDDAYATVHDLLLSVLEAEQVPVTLFVVTDAAASGQAYWWDRLEEAAALARREDWHGFEERCGLPATYRRRWPMHGPHWAMRQFILSQHRGQFPEQWEGALSELERTLRGPELQRPMTWRELDEMMRSDLVDLGVHTVSHPLLPALSEAEQRAEITQSHRILRERYDRTLPILSVPYGLQDDRTLAIARSCGMHETLGLSNATLRATTHGVIPRFCMHRGETELKLTIRLSGILERYRFRLDAAEYDTRALNAI